MGRRSVDSGLAVEISRRNYCRQIINNSGEYRVLGRIVQAIEIPGLERSVGRTYKDEGPSELFLPSEVEIIEEDSGEDVATLEKNNSDESILDYSPRGPNELISSRELLYFAVKQICEEKGLTKRKNLGFINTGFEVDTVRKGIPENDDYLYLGTVYRVYVKLCKYKFLDS